MPWSRRRNNYWWLLAVTAAATGCASAGFEQRSLPAHIDRNALRDSILSSVADEDFDPFDGDDQYVQEGIFGKTRGVIHPDSTSHRTAITHRKVLARIRVTKPYRGLVKDVWNYFAIIDVSADGSGDWATAFVSAGNPLVVRRLTRSPNAHDHPHAKAQWRAQSSAVPWATCDPNTCCCEGTKCNELRY